MNLIPYIFLLLVLNELNINIYYISCSLGQSPRQVSRVKPCCWQNTRIHLLNRHTTQNARTISSLSLYEYWIETLLYYAYPYVIHYIRGLKAILYPYKTSFIKQKSQGQKILSSLFGSSFLLEKDQEHRRETYCDGDLSLKRKLSIIPLERNSDCRFRSRIGYASNDFRNVKTCLKFCGLGARPLLVTVTSSWLLSLGHYDSETSN